VPDAQQRVAFLPTVIEVNSRHVGYYQRALGFQV